MRGGMRGSSPSPRPARADEERPPRPSFALLPSRQTLKSTYFCPNTGPRPSLPAPNPLSPPPAPPAPGCCAAPWAAPTESGQWAVKPDAPRFIPRFWGLHLCCNTAGGSADSFHAPTLASTPRELPWGRWGGCPGLGGGAARGRQSRMAPRSQAGKHLPLPFSKEILTPAAMADAISFRSSEFIYLLNYCCLKITASSARRSQRCHCGLPQESSPLTRAATPKSVAPHMLTREMSMRLLTP